MTLIIGDVGSNFLGLNDCLDSITMLKNLSADIAKFQFFDHEDLYGFPSPTAFEYALPQEWLPKLKEKADARGIEFMCSVFSVEGLKIVDPFVKRHKIASSELSNAPLLEEINKLKKPVILSTGGASYTDIKLALDLLKDCDVTLLYCIANYNPANINLFGIDQLWIDFDRKVGYSCHSREWTIPAIAATRFKASVIEKHFKLRPMDTPDNFHSLTPEDFKKMVSTIRGDRRPAMPDSQELGFIRTSKKRLVAIKDIKAGEPFQFETNYGIYRSKHPCSHGMSGFAYQRVNHRMATRDIAKGQGIGPGDF